ncbi:MAG: hypothetical protein JNM90_07025 [Burkholderiales bacterium]|nr:hypothetical protein [Burkholderiales bacterium]
MRVVADAVNHVLEQHPWARARLAEHAGKSIRVDAAPLQLQFSITAAGNLDPAAAPAAAGVAFRIDPASAPLLVADAGAALSRVHVEGDADLAALVALLLREVRWDAEEDASRIIGDIPAHHAMRAGRALAAWARDASARLADMSAAYLADEAAVLVRARSMEEFARGVAEARDQCARLEKRLALLERGGA